MGLLSNVFGSKEKTEFIKACKSKNYPEAKKLLAADKSLLGAAYPKTAIIDAATAGDIDVVELFAIAGADVNLRDNNGIAPIIYAADGGHIKVVEALIKAGANLNAQDPLMGQTALMTSANKDYREVVEALIKAGADLNLQDKMIRQTAIMYAAYHGHGAMVEMLIKAGADLDKQNAKGQTALTIALEKGHQDVAEILKKPLSQAGQ